jgi:small subunit ribosomal protein S16
LANTVTWPFDIGGWLNHIDFFCCFHTSYPIPETMVVRLRFARHGRRNLPYYHIVAANAKTARNSKPLETIGTYNPIPDNNGIKHVNINVERVKYWLTVGAQPSDSVASLLSKVCQLFYFI